MGSRRATNPIPATKDQAEVTDERSNVLEHARAAAAFLGGLVGVGVGLKQLVFDGNSATFNSVWANIATSTGGLLACALLASSTALISRFASPAPSIANLMTLSKADRTAWAPLAAESQAWREFVGDLVPTAMVGASFGFAIVALTAQFTDPWSLWAVLAIAAFLLPFGAAAVFMGRRRKELLVRIAEWEGSST